MDYGGEGERWGSEVGGEGVGKVDTVLICFAILFCCNLNIFLFLFIYLFIFLVSFLFSISVQVLR